MAQPRKFSIRNDVGDVLALSEHRKTGIASINPKGLGIGFENTLENFGTAQIVKQRRAKLPDFEIDIVLGMNWSNATPRQLYMQIIQFFNKPPYTLIYENGNGKYLKDVELLDMPMTDIKESQTIQETLKFTQTGLWYQDTVFVGNDPAGARTEAEGLLYRQASKLTAADPDKLGRAYNIGGAEYQINDMKSLNLLDGTRDFSGPNWANMDGKAIDGTFKGLAVLTQQSGTNTGAVHKFTIPDDGVYLFSLYGNSKGHRAQFIVEATGSPAMIRDVNNSTMEQFRYVGSYKKGQAISMYLRFSAPSDVVAGGLSVAGHMISKVPDLSGYNLLTDSEGFINKDVPESQAVTSITSPYSARMTENDTTFLRFSRVAGGVSDWFRAYLSRGAISNVFPKVAIKGNTRYTFSAYLRGSGTHTLIAYDSWSNPINAGQSVTLTSDWKWYTFTALSRPTADLPADKTVQFFVRSDTVGSVIDIKEPMINEGSTAEPWALSYSEIPQEWSPSEAELEAANSVGAVYSDNKVINGTGGVFDLHNDSIYFGLQDSSPLEIVVTGQGTNTTPNAIMKNPWWEIVDENGKVLATDMYLTDLLAVEQLVIRSGYGRNAAYIVNTETGARRDAYQLQDHSKTNFVQVPLGASQLRFHTTNNLVMKAGDIRLTMRKEYIAVG